MASVPSIDHFSNKIFHKSSHNSQLTPKNALFPVQRINFSAVPVKESVKLKQKLTVRAINDEWDPDKKLSDSDVTVLEEEPQLEIDVLKKELVDSFSGTNRGLSANSETRAKIVELITQLEAKNPTPAPTEALTLLNGKWILAYTSFAGIFSLLSRAESLSIVKLEEISQTIESENFTVQNTFLFSGPLATASISTNSKYEVRSPKLVQIKFEEGVIGTPQLTDSVELPENVDLLGQQIDLTPLKLGQQIDLTPLKRVFTSVQEAAFDLTPLKIVFTSVQEAAFSVVNTISNRGPFKFSIPKSNAESWLLTTYLDEDIRISRGDGGSIFVLIKAGSPLLSP